MGDRDTGLQDRRSLRRVPLHRGAPAATAGRAAADPAGVADDAATGVGRGATDHRQTVGDGLRGGQHAGVYCVGSVPRSADGTLGAVGLGRAWRLLRHPVGQFRRLADGLCTDHGRRSAPGAA